MNELRNDKNLQEAVSRREQKLPPLPAELNERLMQRLVEPETAPKAKQKRLWFYAAVAVAASIALLIVFNYRQEQTPQEPVVAQQTDKQVVPQPVSEVSEPVEEPETVVAEAQSAQKSVKKQRKVVMQLVELIPTSEMASANVKTLPVSVIDKVKAYDQQSDLSRTTGIDDDDPLVAMATGIDDTDPLVAMAAHVEDIRHRGQRLQQEITALMNN